MRRSPLVRLLGSIFSLVFAVNAALAGRPHGCAADQSAHMPAAAHGSSGHAAHGGGAHLPDRSLPAECDCIGQACSSMAGVVITPGWGNLAVTTLEPAAPDLPGPATRIPVSPPHLLPFSLAPPAQLS